MPSRRLLLIAALGLLLAVGVGALFVSGRISLPGAGRLTPRAELTYWGLWEPAEVVNPLIADYQKDRPQVKVDYTQRSFSTLRMHKETLLTRFREGTGPDIARIHISWLPLFKDELAPLPETVIKKADFAETFYPVAAKGLERDGRVWGIPLEYDGLLLFYNTDFFAEQGIESPPATWEEFRQVAVKLTKMDEAGERIVRGGAAIGAASNVAHAADILGLMLAQSATEFPGELASQPAVDALTFLTNFVTTDKVWDETLPDSITAFAGGQAAMIFAPSWRFFDIQKINPALNFRTAPVPQVPGSEVSWASFWVEVVSADSANPAAAWDFLKFLTQRDQQRKLYSLQSQIRPFGEPFSRKDLGETLSPDEVLGPLMKQAGFAASYPIADYSGNDSLVDTIETAITGVIRGGTDPKGALEAAKKSIEQNL